MTTLVFAFYAEGQRDYRFLLPVVRRVLQRLLPNVDVLDIPFDTLELGGLSQIEKMKRVSREAHGCHMVIFHLDADAPNTESAYKERFEPGFDAIQAAAKTEHDRFNTDIVPVIPVRMTDAWMLVDFEAFRAVVGTKLSSDKLGFVEPPSLVETISDPKHDFEHALRNARRRRRPIPASEVFLPLASRINLERLEQLNAFREFVDRLKEKLRHLHFLERD